MTISACLIIKNEETVIERCINSYRNVVDEIIVVDTGSTDNSVEIARSLGATIYSFSWINDFAAARNFAISKARGEWIVFLDADEFFEEGDAEALASSLEMVKSFDVISVKVVNVTNQMDVLDEVYLYRIFKNNNQIFYKNPIHEELYKKNGELKRALCSDVRVYHTGYDKRVIEKQNKIQRNHELLIKELEKRPTDASIHSYLADQYLQEKKWEEGIKHARLAIKYLNGNVNLLLAKAYTSLINGLSLAGKDVRERIQSINEGLAMLPEHADLYYFSGGEAFLQKRYREAIYFLENALELNKKMRISKISGLLPQISYTLFRSYLALDDEENAINYLGTFLGFNHSDEGAIAEWLLLLAKLPEEQYLEQMKKVYNLENPGDIYFLLTHAIKLRNKKLVSTLYMLFNVPEKGSNIIALYFLLINKRYQQAGNGFLNIYSREQNEEYGIITFLCGLLSKDIDILVKVKQITKNSSLKKLICCLVENKNEIFSNEDKLTYLQVVQDLTLLQELGALKHVLELKTFFNTDIDLEVGHLLYKYGLTDLALPIYLRCFEKGNDPDLLIRIVKILLKNGHQSMAMKMLSLGIKLQMKDFEIYRLIAETGKMFGDEFLVKEITNVARNHFNKIGNYEVTLV